MVISCLPGFRHVNLYPHLQTVAFCFHGCTNSIGGAATFVATSVEIGELLRHSVAFTERPSFVLGWKLGVSLPESLLGDRLDAHAISPESHSQVLQAIKMQKFLHETCFGRFTPDPPHLESAPALPCIASPETMSEERSLTDASDTDNAVSECLNLESDTHVSASYEYYELPQQDDPCDAGVATSPC